MLAHLPPTADNAVLTNASDRTLPVPLTVRDDVPDMPAAVSPSDPRPPGLEPPPGASPGNGEPPEWPEGESRVRPEMSPVTDYPVKDITRVSSVKTTLARIPVK